MMKRLLAALLTLLCLSALPSAALAADSLSVKVDLPYYHVWTTDDSAADDRFTYRWSALTPGAPMPTGRTGSYWDWNLKGNSQGTLSLSFSFSQTGTYQYRLAAYVPQKKAGYVYESRTYQLTVVVQANSSGRLWAEWYVLNEASGSKVDRLDLDPLYSKPKDKDTKKNTSRGKSKSGSGSGRRKGKSGSGGTNSGANGSANGGANGGAKTGDETRLESMASILCVSGLLLTFLVYEELREHRANRK